MKEKIGRILQGLLIISVFYLISHLLVLFQPPNFDTFWHIKNGEWILNNKAIPYHDMFSYFPDLKFMSHEWLFDVILYFVYSFGNMGLAKFFISLIFTATLWVNYKTVRLKVDSRMFSVWFVTIASLLMVGLVQVRPQTVSLLFMSIVVYILEVNTMSRKTIVRAWLIPLIVMLISNLHGGALPLFLGILFVYFINEVIKAVIGRMDNGVLECQKALHLALIGIASVGASLINPYGYTIYEYAVKIMGNPNTSTISEWKPLIDVSTGTFYAVVILLPFLVFIYSKRKIEFRSIFLISVLTLMALLQCRHFSIWAEFVIMLGAVYFYSVFTNIASKLSRYSRMKDYSLKRVNVLKPYLVVMMLGIVMFFNISQSMQLVGYTESSQEAKFLPQKALQFIEDNHIDVTSQRMWNNYDWGGYLIFKGFKVFIDGRSDIYMNSFNPNTTVMDDYCALRSKTPEELKEYLDKNKIEYILDKPVNTLSSYASMSADWTLIYSDNVCSLYKRK